MTLINIGIIYKDTKQIFLKHTKEEFWVTKRN